ncbi:hypothetical protein ACFO5R_10220 [Halosolutus amylolyticus]|uniref:C2H2-type domain-containing protein n=1 Tax=Halosolutus amylolyticus TaxID=2932267 RepID=A0ABD5PPD3_9EURY|nr:hypothetical protein [Halosolutus amylolyticus]
MNASQVTDVESVAAVDRVTDVEYDVPTDETPEHTCPYCDRPFRSERYLTFHVGSAHAEACSDSERELFDEARDDEQYDLFTFHVKAAVSVFMLYFMFTFIYALVWAG